MDLSYDATSNSGHEASNSQTNDELKRIWKAEISTTAELTAKQLSSSLKSKRCGRNGLVSWNTLSKTVSLFLRNKTLQQHTLQASKFYAC